METVAPVEALCVDTPATAAHGSVQALVYIRTSFIDRPVPRAAGMALEGAKSVDADAVGTGAGVFALIHIFASASPRLGVATAAFTGVRSFRVDAFGILALAGHGALVNVLTELPVLGDHLAVAAVAVTGIGAVAVYTAALLFTRVLVAFVHINAVGLQRAELEPWLAEAGVAGLHRNTSPRATYGGGIGTLVNTCG